MRNVNLKYYIVFKRQYNICLGAYVIYKKYISTPHIYYYVGMEYCNSIHKIDRIDYLEISKEEYEKNKNISKVYFKGKEFNENE